MPWRNINALCLYNVKVLTLSLSPSTSKHMFMYKPVRVTETSCPSSVIVSLVVGPMIGYSKLMDAAGVDALDDGYYIVNLQAL